MAFPPDISARHRDLDCHEFVYHYTSRDVGLQHILGEQRLRLGLLKNTNDPRENRTWSFGISGTDLPEPTTEEERRESVQRTFEICEQAPKIIQENCKVLCATMDDPSYAPYADGHTDAKRGYGHSRMWAQYGELHKGICLIFHKEILDQEVTAALDSTTYDL